VALAVEHQSWSEANEAFYRDVLAGDKSPNPDWAMTVLFYAAVHAIEAALVHVGAKGRRTHTTRKEELDKRGWRTLTALYGTLYTRSLDSRYHCIRPSQMQLALAEQALSQVRAEIAALGLGPY
jgi:hypothetical protein